jgi:hypothetical protein
VAGADWDRRRHHPRIAAEIAEAAFEEVVIDQPWTDMKGEARQDDRPARGVSRHARHLGPFQRLPDRRALHMLQILLGSSIAPAASASSRPTRGRSPAQPSRMAVPARTRRLPGRIWAIRAGRKTCCSTPTADGQRIDKAFSWDAPLSAHG